MNILESEASVDAVFEITVSATGNTFTEFEVIVVAVTADTFKLLDQLDLPSLVTDVKTLLRPSVPSFNCSEYLFVGSPSLN